LIRFEAELPNEMWQADITHWRLTGGGHAEILNMIDDHSRLFLASRAYRRAKAGDVAEAFRSAVALHGAPASLLCDNGAVFTATPRGGKVLLQAEMERLGVVAKNSRPYHPQTCGKVERLHQTLKRYLQKQAPAKTLVELQSQLDAFAHYYNAIRPHRALAGRTPLQAYSARVKARPVAEVLSGTHFRIRHDKVDTAGTVTLRYDSRLHHIGLGRAHKGKGGQAARRRLRHPRARRPNGRADPPVDARSESRLPADRRELRCLRCPATSVSDVATHHIMGAAGFEPAF
jgi:hypothetical protein